MKKRGCSEDEAYVLLRRTAMNQNRKIAELARSLVAAAALLGAGDRMSERVVAAFVPLVDCAVLVAAREQGFAAAEGLDLVLVKEPSWASLRDHLCLGHVDCAHALAPLPVALTLGVGQVQVDCVAPFVLGRGGNAITVSTRCSTTCTRSRSRELVGSCGGRPRARGRRAPARRAADARHGVSVLESQLRLALLARGGRHPSRSRRATRRDSAAVDGRQLASRARRRILRR